MAKGYSSAEGVSGAVENEAYCMPSWQKRNVEDMNDKMGYHEMGDLANTGRPPAEMKAEHSNRQMGPEASNPRKND